MTVVLVHGNPETDAVWDPLVDALGRDDVIRLSPPGFGAPLPDGWPATHLAYRDWLEDELARLAGPIDLVGHDWGGNHVVNAMMNRPELVRSWASDIIGVFDPDYVWHEAALVWQTPGDGERLADAMMSGTLEDRTERMVGLGMTPRGRRQGGHRPRPGDASRTAVALPIRTAPRNGRGGPAVGAGRGATGSAPVGHRRPLRRLG